MRLSSLQPLLQKKQVQKNSRHDKRKPLDWIENGYLSGDFLEKEAKGT